MVDEDEFEEACRTVPYPPEIAAAALRSRDEVRDMLEQHAEPFHSVGWAYLNASLHR